MMGFQATGVEPGSSSSVTGARPAGQDAGSRAASTSGRPAEGEEQQSLLDRITAPFKEIAMRGTVYTSFIFAKQPKRIRQVSTGTLHGNSPAIYIYRVAKSIASTLSCLVQRCAKRSWFCSLSLSVRSVFQCHCFQWLQVWGLYWIAGASTSVHQPPKSG